MLTAKTKDNRRRQPKKLYVCDRKKCSNCAKECRHTSDEHHALYTTHTEFVFMPDGDGGSEWEVVRD